MLIRSSHTLINALVALNITNSFGNCCIKQMKTSVDYQIPQSQLLSVIRQMALVGSWKSIDIFPKHLPLM